MREFDMECGCCIHYQEHKAKHDYCNKHRDKIPFTGFCDDFWPDNPTCAECRFYDLLIPDHNGICRHIGNMLVTPERSYAARMNADDYCSEWRCRVQS